MEQDLKNKISAMINLLDNLSVQLDELNPDNFEDKFQLAIETMMVIQKLKDEMIKKHGVDYLQKNVPEVCERAKLIEKKYDNIIEQFKVEASKLEKEISSLNSQRKIINYLR